MKNLTNNNLKNYIISVIRAQRNFLHRTPTHIIVGHDMRYRLLNICDEFTITQPTLFGLIISLNKNNPDSEDIIIR